MASVFDYTNYRRFIRDFFTRQKEADKKFSHSYFAQKAGFKSKTFMLKVMNGEKGLARASIRQVAQAMGLGKKESDYFEALVFFNEAKSLDEKNLFYRKLQSSHKSHKALRLRKDQYEYFYQWYHAPLREIITYCHFGDDFKKLGRMLNPPITGKQARESIELLLRLRLIKKKDDRYIQTNKVVTTGDEVRSLAVQNFQRDNMELAKKALAVFAKHREISTLTFGTNHKGFKQIKSEIVAFRKRLIQIMLSHRSMDRVYQLNFQLFPLTSVREEKGGAL